MSITPSNYWPLGSTIQKTFTDMSATNTRDQGILSVNPTNGHIVMIYRRGAIDAGTMYIRHSSDGGATWGAESAIYGGAAVYLRIAGGYISTGRLLLFASGYDPVNFTFSALEYIYSDNDGSSWSRTQSLNVSSNSEYGAYGHIVDIGKVTQGSNDNTLYQTWYGKNGSTYTLNLYKSTNSGTSFTPVTQTIYSGTAQYSEPSMVNVGGGCFIVLAKINNVAAFRQFTNDNNITSNWSEVSNNANFDTITTNTSPMLSFINYKGIGIVACYYINRYSSPYKSKVIFGLAKNLLTDETGWKTNTLKIVYESTPAILHNYQSFYHPQNQFKGIGNCFIGTGVNTYPKIIFTPQAGMSTVISNLLP